MCSIEETVSLDMVVIELATALGRHRALTDQESQWLERSVRRQLPKHNKPRWEAKHDTTLKRLIKRGKKPRDIARAMGRTEQAVWDRIKKLRKAGKIGYLCQSPVAVILPEEVISSHA